MWGMSEIAASDRHRLAEAIGVNEQYLYQCLTGRRSFPVERVMPIESAARRLGIPGLTRREMRPNDWALHWPELATQHSQAA